jgi:hypothetical protein
MAKQRVTPGGTIDTVTPAELGEAIANAFSYQAVEEYDRHKGVVLLDANGAGHSIIGIKVPSHYDYFFERVAIGGGAQAANALILMCENEISDVQLLEVIQLGGAGYYSDSFSNDIHVPAGSVVKLGITGGPANGQVTYNMQVRIEKHRNN